MSCFNDVAHFGRTNWNVIQSSGLCSVTPQTPLSATKCRKTRRTRVVTKAFEGHIADALPIAIYPRLFEYPKGRRLYPWLLVFSCLADPARIRSAALTRSSPLP